MHRTVILLVEDNEDDVDLTIRALSKNHVSNKVVVVRDGEEALEYLFATGKYVDRKPEDLPAVVLLDLNLPKINGLDVLAKIRADERMRYLPVVVLTTSLEECDLISSYERGANSYVRKPVDFKEFIDAVQRLGIYWTLHNEVPRGKQECAQK